MSENIANYKNYLIQLQQVETALENDPENEDLQKLRIDLSEVMKLTKDLMTQEEIDHLDDENVAQHNYKPGDYVMAPWSVDGQFYEGQIEDLTSDGQCTVVFRHQKKTIAEVCLLELLKPISGKNRNKTLSNNSHFSASTSGQGTSSRSATGTMNYKQQQDFRDIQKKKQQKRKDKVRELELEREKDKNKWQNFANKVSKKKTGHGLKKSIFATPDSITGRVGIGTCGIGGKGMTEYQQKMEKVKKVSNFTMPKFSILDEDGRAPQSLAKPQLGSNRNRFM